MDGLGNKRKGASLPPNVDEIIEGYLTAHFGGGPATYTRGIA